MLQVHNLDPETWLPTFSNFETPDWTCGAYAFEESR